MSRSQGTNETNYRITGNAMGSVYGLMETEDGTRDFGEVTEGESITLTLKRTVASMASGSSTSYRVLPDTDVYILNEDDFAGQKVTKWTSLGYTDEKGQITVPGTLEPGRYYISANGNPDSERGPSVFVLTVKRDTGDVVFGDVNGDGLVNSGDAVLVLKHTAGTLGSADFIEAAADVNGDELINSGDAVLILKRTAGTIPAFPVE